MPLPPDQAWFPPKTYGWGWGVPRRWQGWVVMGAYLAGLILGAVGLARRVYWFVPYTVALSAVLTWLCWWKGEPARWRWGDGE